MTHENERLALIKVFQPLLFRYILDSVEPGAALFLLVSSARELNSWMTARKARNGSLEALYRTGLS